MVFMINGVKHACAACIRGHRVKKCNHKDRPMVPLVKRGRQISQCTHCRDLRLTNRSHVKCTCAIASTPNPINGCLCEVILTCTCVASHLQEVQEDGRSAYSSSPSVSCCSSSPKVSDTNSLVDASSPAPSVDQSFFESSIDQLFQELSVDQLSTAPSVNQQVITNQAFNPPNNTDVSDLLHFLENDLDKYLIKPQ